MTKQISLRLPGELHERLKAAADLNRRSLHAEILWRLEHSEQPDEDKASTTRQH
jgi:predicted DNA-binding protein